ncbi:MAG: hypothetical protein WBL23_06545 [Salinisphaera sp.]|uniref:hypothetical protein n=1 Tax=Salinisphaera sp. TaxID=1914330 RepID=UPI003C7CA060
MLLPVWFAGLAIAAAAISWLLPCNMASAVGGIQNCASNIVGILGLMVTAFIVEASGSFLAALRVAGAAALGGALIYIFGLGPVEAIVA